MRAILILFLTWPGGGCFQFLDWNDLFLMCHICSMTIVSSYESGEGLEKGAQGEKNQRQLSPLTLHSILFFEPLIICAHCRWLLRRCLRWDSVVFLVCRWWCSTIKEARWLLKLLIKPSECNEFKISRCNRNYMKWKFSGSEGGEIQMSKLKNKMASTIVCEISLL